MTAARVTTCLRITIAAVLGSIGAAAGFTHTHDWAVANGQAGWIAWAVAVVIEGMVVMAGFEIHADRHHHTGPARRVTFPMVVLVAGFGIQMTAQVALAPPSPAGWLVAATPALGFLVVVKLLMRRAPTHTGTAPAPAPAPAPIPVSPVPQHIPAPAPAGSTLAKLPASPRERITAVTEHAHSSGRAVTADDITDLISLPDPVLAALVDELNTTVNGHPITT
ncbi:DUF2637 domain-containing protein [Amycolatopsis antarctica]|uniref:DUF2637 domain-containing protein n=1 Tax=Amycolatopsis antarctica TaxID=1854586 RepID=A0A263D7W0_9PSEU|nr:DUF2637 domain-containing protein [Amycolatopsis antarctica]OZM73566.1 DUF2637 domain-containing protein [Amycolatopsis antarctica]